MKAVYDTLHLRNKKFTAQILLYFLAWLDRFLFIGGSVLAARGLSSKVREYLCDSIDTSPIRQFRQTFFYSCVCLIDPVSDSEYFHVNSIFYLLMFDRDV